MTKSNGCPVTALRLISCDALQTDFDSKTNGKDGHGRCPENCGLLYRNQNPEETDWDHPVIIIKMIGKTDAIQVLPYSGLDHVRHQCVTVSAVMRVHMCIPKHKEPPFSVWLILEKSFRKIILYFRNRYL